VIDAGRAGLAKASPNPPFEVRQAREVRSLASRGLKFARRPKLEPADPATMKADFKPWRLPDIR
jgi:hypothetical protein